MKRKAEKISKGLRVISHRFKMFLAISPGETFIPGSGWKMTERAAIVASRRRAE